MSFLNNSESRGRGVVGGIDGVILVPDTLPEPYRRTPSSFGRGLSPAADPGLVAAITAASLPHETGTPTSEIDAAEEAFGYSFPPDVRAMYETARSGPLDVCTDDPTLSDRFGSEIPEGDGLLICGLDNDEARRYAEPVHRMVSWSFAYDALVPEDPHGRIQQLGHSSAWFVIGEDEAGGYVAVDMEPGPNGTVGQLIYLPRDLKAGAFWLAPSLTEYLTTGGTLEYEYDDYEDPAIGLAVRIGSHTDQTFADIQPHTEVLHINNCTAPQDLSSISGHPTLRMVEITPHMAVGYESLTTLPALEYASLHPDVWRDLLAADSVPRGLLVAGFARSDDSFDELTSLANSLLAVAGQTSLEIETVHRELPT